MTTRTAEAATGRSGAAGDGRIALWDNARALLIMLVVLGHSIETVEDAPGSDAVYTAVYAFHIPAFLLVSGWFAHAAPLDRRALLGTARLFGAWLIAEVAWVLLRAGLGETPLPGDLLVVPAWTLWFLVALVAMRVLLPYLALLRAPAVVTGAVSLAVGLLPAVSEPFAASRTIAFLPFFVLGWQLRRAGVGEARWFLTPSPRLRALAVAAGVLAVLAILQLRTVDGYSREFLYWRRGYDDMGWDVAPGLLLRLATGAIALVLTAAVLILVPRGRHRFSVAGANTLPVYLLHAPIVEALDRGGVIRAVGALPVFVPIAVVFAITATAVLGSAPVARLMRPVLQPDLLFRPAAPETRRP